MRRRDHGRASVERMRDTVILHLKPRFHVQLLHAIILGSERGCRCQSVCVCDVTSKMSADEELLSLSAAARHDFIGSI